MSFFIIGEPRQRLADRHAIVLEDIRRLLQEVRTVAVTDGGVELRTAIAEHVSPAAAMVRDVPLHFDEYLHEGSRVLGTLVKTLAALNRQLRQVLNVVEEMVEDPVAASAALEPLMRDVSQSLAGFVTLLKEVESEVRAETEANLSGVDSAGNAGPAARSRSKSTENLLAEASAARPKTSSWQTGSARAQPKAGRNTAVGTAGGGFLGAARVAPKAGEPLQDDKMDELIAVLSNNGPAVSKPKRPTPKLPPKRGSNDSAGGGEGAQSLTTLSGNSKSATRPLTIGSGANDVRSYTLQLDGDGSTVVSGTVERLVEQLVVPTSVDGKYRFQFFFCYRDFLAPKELLSMLKQWFIHPNVVAAAALSGPSEMPEEKTKQIVRVKTLAVLRYWVDTYWPDFHHESNALLNDLQEFLASDVTPILDQGANQITSTIMKKQEGGAEHSENRGQGLLLSAGARPRPMLTGKDGLQITANSQWRFRDIPAEEVARQLTLMEFTLFRRIHPWELSGQAWTKDAKDLAQDAEKSRAQKRMSLMPQSTVMRAKNVTAMITAFNRVSNWVKNEILNEKTPKARAEAISHFIQIGKKCHLKLQSFNTAMEIVASLNHSSITRLKQTWPHVSAKRRAQLDQMAQLMNGNFSALREQVAEASFRPPLLPYLGVYLSDLTMIDENSDTVDLPPGAPKDIILVNFYKYRKQAVIFEEISGCQLTPYNLEEVRFIQDYIEKVYVIEDEKELFDMSLQVEPRTEGDAVDVRSFSEKARDYGFNARTMTLGRLGTTLRRSNSDTKSAGVKK